MRHLREESQAINDLPNCNHTTGSQVQEIQLRSIAIFVRFVIENIRFS